MRGTLGTLLKRQSAGLSCRSGRSAPPFCLGFSAGLLQPGDWDGDIQYEFEAIREPGHATTGYGDFFVFHVDEDGEPNILWRTDEADTNAYHITPGTYDHAYWAFTEPGTYVFHVQVKGHPNPAPSGGDPLIEAETVTSVVRRYTFHVGDLAVNHDPVFEVERSVSENATGGTHVGAPIIVHDLEATTLCFALAGPGAKNFTLEGTTGTDECGTMTAVTRSNGRIGAPIIVKERSYLDYETHPAYDLRLQVTDGLDPEGNKDPSIDDSIAVRITLIDGPEHVRGSALILHVPRSATAGESITLSASFVGGWPTNPGDVRFRWHRRVAGGVAETGPMTIGVAHHTETFDRSGAVEYSVAAQWWEENNSERMRQSPWITVHWQ